MLAVFEKSISKTPIELSLPGVRTGRFNRSPEEIAELFGSWKSDSTFYHVSNCNFLALSHIDEYYPRSIVVMDDIYCIFSGALDNSSELRQLYGLSKKAAEATIIVEAYKMLCDRAPYPPGQVIADLQGSFAFILFDRRDSVLFLASDRDAHVRLYWGTATDGSLVCADDQNVISTCCGNAYTTFPRGCIYTSGKGLMNFDRPFHNVRLTPVLNSEGDIIGVEYHVEHFMARLRNGGPPNGPNA